MEVAIGYQDYFQVLASVAVTIGVCIAAYQLRDLKKIHRDNHDWNRKIEAQKALLVRLNLDASKVHDAFGPVRNDRTIESNELKEKLENKIDYPELRTELHGLLNYYESLARGIHLNMYDENVVKLARQASILSIYNKYKNYIQFRQEHRNDKAYLHLQKLVARWLEENET